MSRPQVVLLDYGSGNLRSAYRALVAAGADVELTSDRDAAMRADGLVVPGVGAFAACMSGLTGVGGDTMITERIAANGPVLGICVGHQVLFSNGVEHDVDTPGVGVLPGTVERLAAERLPHIGWNTVASGEGSVLFDGLDGAYFYFVHSYAVRTPVPDGIVTWAEHEGDRFVAAVERGPLAATQFHPEKSGDAGARLLRGWVSRLS